MVYYHTVSAGMSKPHSFATRTAAEYAAGVGGCMLKQTFRDFVFSTNTDGSGKAASYARVRQVLGKCYVPRLSTVRCDTRFLWLACMMRFVVKVCDSAK